jgi:hypothetical protein
VSVTPDDEPSSEKDRDKDDPRQVLSGFLTETTRRVRRTLLAVTTVAIASKLFGVRVTTLSCRQRTDERWLPICLFVAVAYFWGLFMVYAIGDAQRVSVQIWEIYRSGTSLGPTNSLRHRDSKSASFVMSLRVLADVLLPMLYGAAGLVTLLPLG